jgi:methionine-rich copper-binding protein CopC
LDATVPSDGATGVAVDTSIQLTFSEAMDTASVEGALSFAPAIACTFAWSSGDTVLTCDPDSDLAAGTDYDVTVSTSAQDADGTSLEAAASFGFETAAGPTPPAPTVVTVDPADGATGVPRNRSVTLTFSEPMDEASTEAALSFAPPVTCDVTWNAASTELTCSPQSDLAATTAYTVTVAGTAESQAGATLDGAFESTFTTGTTTLDVCTFGTSTFGSCVFGP